MTNEEQEIRSRYQELHDQLSNAYYIDGEFSKKDFDHFHAGNWSDMDSELIAKGFKIPGLLTRDSASEIDELKARVKRLEPLVLPGEI